MRKVMTVRRQKVVVTYFMRAAQRPMPWKSSMCLRQSFPSRVVIALWKTSHEVPISPMLVTTTKLHVVARRLGHMS